MKDQYSTGGVSVLISDLLSENDFKVICLNPTDRKDVISLQNSYDHKSITARHVKILYWLICLSKVVLFYLMNPRINFGAIISCNIASSIVTSIFYPKKLIIWENVDYLKSRRLFNLLRMRFALMRGARLIVTSESEYTQLKKLSWANHGTLYVPNWTPPLKSRRIVKRVVGVGFLEERKGFDILLREMDPDQFKLIPLEIYGNGPQKKLLSKIIDERKLLRVSLCGYISNAYTEIEQSAGFIMPSRFEGSPLTLLHALKCGMPLAISDQIADAKMLKDKYPERVFLLRIDKSHAFASELEKFMQAVNVYCKGDYHTVIADEQRKLSHNKIMHLVNLRTSR